MPFTYKTVLILGATSGIGLALAEKIIAHGSHVIALGRRQENLDELVKKHGSDKVSAMKFDITDLKGIPDLVKKCVSLPIP
jgi:NADP-dependent 3-hydroxy acid dehydrogenase YdfG